MKRGAWTLAALCSLVLAIEWALPVAALSEPTDQQPILIAELQTASADHASEKLVALYNPNMTTVDVTGWQLRYRSAHSVDDAPWRTIATIDCETIPQPDHDEGCKAQIATHGFLWLATYDLGAERPAHPLQHKGLATKGGQLRLARPAQDDQAEMVQDMLGYGNSAVADGDHAAEAPPKGKSLKRRCSDGQCSATHDNGNDFYVEEDATMQNEEQPVTSAANDETTNADQPQQNQTYPSVVITELLPQTHRSRPNATEKFVELYNPNDQPVALQDYELQSGKGWKSHYTIPAIALQPHDYHAFFYDQTHLVLSARGGAVRLLNPNGEVISQTQYDAAKAGVAWAQAEDGSWHWSTTPTPGQANKLTSDIESPALAAPSQAHHSVKRSAATKTVKAQHTKAASEGKVKGASTKKPGTKTSSAKAKAAKTKTSGAKATPQPLAQPAQGQPKQGTNYWFIGAAATLGGGYALYEYRQEIWNIVQKLKARFSKAS